MDEHEKTVCLWPHYIGFRHKNALMQSIEQREVHPVCKKPAAAVPKVSPRGIQANLE